jgi:nicotinamide-nucleotide amidase
VTLEEEIRDLLTARGWTLAVAESCTGGLVAHRITNVSGSSVYFLGGVVAYADQAKEALLGVARGTLLAYGAASDPVAREMARGVRQRLGALIGLSTTGIAGPTGATPTKPVGLAYVALSVLDTTTSMPAVEVVRRYLWRGNRLENKEATAEAVLRLLLDYLQDPKNL